MRRRRTVVEVTEIPERLDVFTVADWPVTGDAYGMWRAERREWFTTQRMFPIELCEGELWDGTGSEMSDARDEWEAAYGRELPTALDMPDDPFDPDEI